MKPLQGWDTAQRGFTFGQIYPPGYGSASGKPHLGLDIIVPVGTEVRAPFEGRIERHDGIEGGVTLHFFQDWTDKIIRFMHLSEVKLTGRVSAGEVIALTGQTGSLSPIPHLHVDISPSPLILSFSRFIDPGTYPWASKVPVTIYGQVPTMFPDAFNAQVLRWSRGDIVAECEVINAPVSYPLSVEQAYYIRTLNAPDSSFFIIVCNPQPDIYKTFGTSDGDAFLTIGGPDTLTLSYEFSHAIQGFANSHRGPYPYIPVDDTMGGVTDTQRYAKYESVKSHFGYYFDPTANPLMTSEEVIKHYVLAFYREPDADELAFWTGKPSLDFLTKAISDRAAFLQSHE